MVIVFWLEAALATEGAKAGAARAAINKSIVLFSIEDVRRIEFRISQ
jgi:hypothetical protein